MADKNKKKKTTNPKKELNKKLLQQAKMDEIEEEILEIENLYEVDEIEGINYDSNDDKEHQILTPIKPNKKPDDYEWLERIDILRIDLMIFNILKQKAIERNTEFIDIYRYVTLEDLFPLKCSKKWVAKRIFFNIENWFIDIKKISEKTDDTNFNINNILQMCRSRKLKPDWIIYEEKWNKKINYDKYYETFLELKLTPAWLEKSNQITYEIKEELRNASWLYKNIKVIQWYAWNLVWNYKATAWLMIAFVLALWMFYHKDQVNINLKSNNLTASLLGQAVERNQFQNVDKKSMYYITLINTLIQTPWTENIIKNMGTILERKLSNTNIEFKIILNDWVELNIVVENKNWIYQVKDMNKFTNKQEKKVELKY